jgi:flagellar biosynthesis component FlhA
MRKDLLIASAILLILGFAISGSLGTILLSLGILVLLYVIFSKDNVRETQKITHYPESKRKTYKSKGTPREYSESEKNPLKDSYKSSSAQSNKTTDQTTRRRKSKERIARELREWRSEKPGCPKCGSSKNPPNARFCADCGAKL